MLKAIVLFLVPLRDDMWNIGINPKRIEPWPPGVSKAGGQNPPRKIGIAGQKMLWTYTGQRTFLGVSSATQWTNRSVY